MFKSTKWQISLLTLCSILAVGAFVVPAQGDATSDRAMRGALQKGKALFQKIWRKGGKSCFTCHGAGRNKLTSTRLRSFPKYDKSFKRVITAQQKMNQMIRYKAGGPLQTLGSDDMNALEAYISRLR